MCARVILFTQKQSSDKKKDGIKRFLSSFAVCRRCRATATADFPVSNEFTSMNYYFLVNQVIYRILLFLLLSSLRRWYCYCFFFLRIIYFYFFLLFFRRVCASFFVRLRSLPSVVCFYCLPLYMGLYQLKSGFDARDYDKTKNTNRLIVLDARCFSDLVFVHNVEIIF